MAAFPKITERAASKRTDLFRKDVAETVMVILWFAIPAATIAFFMRGYLVRLLVGGGNLIISQILGWFVVSIVFRAIFHSITRAFYAQQDTKTPLYVSFATVGLNIVLAFTLTKLYGIVGLAMAQSAVAVFEVAILLRLLTKKLGQFFDVGSLVKVAKMLAAAFGASVVNYGLIRYLFPLRADDVGFFSLAPKFGFIVSVTILTYFVLSYVLRIQYTQPVLTRLKRMVFPKV